MTTLIDTNILIYLTTETSSLHEWAVEQLLNCKNAGPALVSDIVYCEFAVGMPSQSAVDEVISLFDLERFRTPDTALYRAATAFKEYKNKNKGEKTGVLPDYLIGAAAVVLNAPLLTSNPKDFVNYFPELSLICPD